MPLLSSRTRHKIGPGNLPGNDSVQGVPLFGGRTPQIDAGCLDTFVSQEVRQERNVVAFFEEILGEPVPEGMGMNHLRVEAELLGKTFEPERQSSGGEGVSVSVPEQVSAIDPFSPQPQFRFFPQLIGDVDPPDFSALGIEVHVPGPHVLGLHLQQLADPCARTAHEPDREIPLVIPAVLQPLFEVAVVGVADYILQEGTLRVLYPFYFKGIRVDELQVLVEGVQSQVHRLGFVMLEQEDFVVTHTFFAHPAIAGKKETHGLHIGAHGVLGESRTLQEELEFSIHGFSQLS